MIRFAHEVMDLEALASVQDRDAARPLLWNLRKAFPSVRFAWADGGYAGQLVTWAKTALKLTVQIVRRPDDLHTFQVLPRRWVVERTLAWITRHRRTVDAPPGCPADSGWVGGQVMRSIPCMQIVQLGASHLLQPIWGRPPDKVRHSPASQDAQPPDRRPPSSRPGRESADFASGSSGVRSRDGVTRFKRAQVGDRGSPRSGLQGRGG
jgi:transposase